MKIILRSYQEKAVEDIRQAYRNGYRAPLYVLPTGGGKTVIFSYIAHHAAAKGNRILILTHRQELLDQSSDTLTKFGVPHGYIIAGRATSDHPVQIASVMTLVRRLEQYDQPPDLIVVDECHRSRAMSWHKILENYPQSRLLCTTATACRLDGSGLGVDAGGFNDILIEGPNIQELIGDGYLSRTDVYAPPVGADLSNLHIQAGDYKTSDMDEAINKPKIHGNAVDHYKKICPGVQAIAFCVSVKHADNLAEEFDSRACHSKAIHGGLPREERDRIMNSFRDGQIKVLTSCDLISEGIDVPAVTCGIMLRPTASLGLWIQMCGRILRPFPGKERAIILDHTNNVERHGLPTEVREWSLDGVKRRSKRGSKEELPIRYRTCHKCYAVYTVNRPACPQCGTPYQLSAREIQEVEGELKKVEEEQHRKDVRREAGRAQSMDDLIKLGHQRGYKNPKGWAWYIYQARLRKKQKQT